MDEVLPVTPPARLMASDVATMLGACAAGVGIAQVMALGTGHLLASGQLVELFPDWPDETFPLSAIYPSRQHRAAKVQVFTDFCVQLLEADNTAGQKLALMIEAPASTRSVFRVEDAAS